MNTRIAQAIELVQAQAQYNGHSLAGLETGAIPFATIPQVGFLAGLLRKCGCPEEWRLYLTGRFIGRELRSSKDLSMAEASALLDYLLVGPDGLGDSKTEPCAEAQRTIGLMLVHVMAAGAAKMTDREKGGQRAQVIQQLGFC